MFFSLCSTRSSERFVGLVCSFVLPIHKSDESSLPTLYTEATRVFALPILHTEAIRVFNAVILISVFTASFYEMPFSIHAGFLLASSSCVAFSPPAYLGVF